MGRNQRAWSPERRARFAQDWNDGLDTDALREKYGTRSPAGVAAELRKLGFTLADRRPRARAETTTT